MQNIRVILVNGPDYPGATPYNLEERVRLFSVLAEATTNGDAALPKMVAFLKEDARKLHRLLTSLVADSKIPRARPEHNSGGIVLVGWSLGVRWLTALLANVTSFPDDSVDLSSYVRRVVFYGAYS